MPVRAGAPSVYFRGAYFWVRVPRSDRRQVRVSTGTNDKRTARALARMVSQLQTAGESRVLDAVL